MHYIILGLLGIMATAGLIALLKVLKNKRPLRVVVLAHRLLAVAVVIMLLTLCFIGGTGVQTSLLIFILAVTGGYYLLFKDLRGKTIPKNIALVLEGMAPVVTVIFVAYVFGFL